MGKSTGGQGLRQPCCSFYDVKSDDLKSWRRFDSANDDKNDNLSNDSLVHDVNHNQDDVQDDSMQSACTTCEWSCPTSSDRQTIVDHFHSPWHAANARRRAGGRAHITEDRFDDEDCDSASSSGSDDEASTSEAALALVLRKGAQHYAPLRLFVDDGNRVRALYNTFIQETIPTPTSCPRVAVLLLSGGHFAAACFDRSKIVHHKALHRYTTRAKQGGSQASRDGQQGGSAPKSAGAQIRRYNEDALAKDIDSLLATWSPFLSSCDRIYLRCAAYQRRLFVRSATDNGRDVAHRIVKSDARLSGVPFVTRRPTYDECKRVHERLTGVYDMGDVEELNEELREIEENMKHVTVTGGADDEYTRTKHALPSTDHVEKVDVEDDKQAKEKLVKKTAVEVEKSVVSLVSAADSAMLYSLVLAGDVDKLTVFTNEKTGDDAIDMRTFMHTNRFGVGEQTLLHVAATKGLPAMVTMLLSNGCDPTIGDKHGNVPFTVSADKPTRRAFMQFRADCPLPSSIDWNAAQIPVLPVEAELTDEQVAQKAAQKARKKERDKLKKAANKEKQREEDEKNRYLNLSDREKRALAAERRLTAMTTSSADGGSVATPVLSRCYQCAVDITGKVPFEYSDFRFCTPACVKKHRAKTK